jgi:E3 SUMO-protein ligase RanBP2
LQVFILAFAGHGNILRQFQQCCSSEGPPGAHAQEPTKKKRVVMRREQVLKICANFYILPDMKADPHQKSASHVLVHVPSDFSDPEEGPKDETFLMRFKSADIATIFMQIFNATVEVTPKKEEKKKPEVVQQPQAAGFDMSKFKPNAGSWECEACLVNNSTKKNVCVA